MYTEHTVCTLFSNATFIRGISCLLNKDRQLYVTCFIISLFTAQHVSNVSTSIFRSLRLIVDLFHVLYALVRCVLALRCGSAGVVWYPYAG